MTDNELLESLMEDSQFVDIMTIDILEPVNEFLGLILVGGLVSISMLYLKIQEKINNKKLTTRTAWELEHYIKDAVEVQVPDSFEKNYIIYKSRAKGYYDTLDKLFNEYISIVNKYSVHIPKSESHKIKQDLKSILESIDKWGDTIIVSEKYIDGLKYKSYIIESFKLRYSKYFNRENGDDLNDEFESRITNKDFKDKILNYDDVDQTDWDGINSILNLFSKAYSKLSDTQWKIVKGIKIRVK